MRAAAVGLLLAVPVLAGCAHTAPPPTAGTPKPPIPCVSPADDRLFATCLRVELDEVWRAEFRAAGRTYTSPRLTVGDDPSRQGDHTPDNGPDRAFYSPLGGIHLPQRYLDAVHLAYGPRSHAVLAFTMSHEAGHHLQFLLHPHVDAPITDQEAQADCYAGVWARKEADASKLDIGEFRSAAAAELHRLSTYPREVATHGDPGQRVASLDKGLRSGDPAACDVAQLTWH